jgi:hypothetical protein
MGRSVFHLNSWFVFRGQSFLRKVISGMDDLFLKRVLFEWLRDR